MLNTPYENEKIEQLLELLWKKARFDVHSYLERDYIDGHRCLEFRTNSTGKGCSIKLDYDTKRIFIEKPCDESYECKRWSPTVFVVETERQEFFLQRIGNDVFPRLAGDAKMLERVIQELTQEQTTQEDA